MKAALTEPAENPSFLESELLTYIGNKRSLLPFIGEAVSIVKSRLNRPKLTFLDLFSGSGVVSRFMKAHATSITCNDSEFYASIINDCYLSNRSAVDYQELSAQLAHLEKKIASDWRRGFIAELYAPKDDDNVKKGERVFYTRRNAEYIDTARQHIAGLPDDMQKFFLGAAARTSLHPQ